MARKTIVFLSLICMTAFVFGGVTVGEKPAELIMDGRDGGRVDRTPWSSSELRDKVWCLFYVDPDVSDLNEAAEDSLDVRDYSAEELKTVAVINMDAAKLPKFAISIVLKNKQKQYPGTIYVKDNKRVFVEKWGLTDDTYCTLVFNKEGKLIYRKDGQMSESDIVEYLAVIEAAL